MLYSILMFKERKLRPRLFKTLPKPYVVSGEQDCLTAKLMYRCKVVFLLSTIQISIFIVKLWAHKGALRSLHLEYIGSLLSLSPVPFWLSPTFLYKFESNILMRYYIIQYCIDQWIISSQGNFEFEKQRDKIRTVFICFF